MTGPTGEDVEAALETLRNAGWEIRTTSGYGRLADTDPPILMHVNPMTGGAEANDAKTYRHTTAMQPWQEIP